MNTYYRQLSSLNESQLADLKANYISFKNQAESGHTHFFGGRFENICLKGEHIPGLNELMHEALDLAKGILCTDSELHISFWFNEMQQGHSTTKHTHDEDDELLSGVFYVNVPENSGDLVLSNTESSDESSDEKDDENNDEERIAPKAGEFIFFKPSLSHRVAMNHSNEMRLSIWMNIWPKN